MSSEDAKTTEWQVTQLEQGLGELERLQYQLDALRFAIPTLTRPLTGSQPSTKGQAARDVKHNATMVITQLDKFRTTWTSEKTQAILAHARRSASDDADLSKASDVPAWGWSDKH